MKREEIIKMLRVCADDGIICPACSRYEQYEYGGTAECHEKLMQEAADALEAAIREREERRWIPVTERLPKEWVDALVLSRYGFCEVAVYLGNPGKWRITWNHDLFEVDSITHWMPLPDPPKEDAP